MPGFSLGVQYVALDSNWNSSTALRAFALSQPGVNWAGFTRSENHIVEHLDVNIDTPEHAQNLVDKLLLVFRQVIVGLSLGKSGVFMHFQPVRSRSVQRPISSMLQPPLSQQINYMRVLLFARRHRRNCEFIVKYGEFPTPPVMSIHCRDHGQSARRIYQTPAVRVM
jgi:hypothetical protein